MSCVPARVSLARCRFCLAATEPAVKFLNRRTFLPRFTSWTQFPFGSESSHDPGHTLVYLVHC